MMTSYSCHIGLIHLLDIFMLGSPWNDLDLDFMSLTPVHVPEEPFTATMGGLPM